MGRIDRATEVAIARLAIQCNGLVTRDALLDEEVGRAAIDRRVCAGRLRPVHTGVYFVGHGELSRDQRQLAAVLACGSGALLARASAAELWRLLSAGPGPPEVLRAGPRRDGPVGVRLYRTGHLPSAERATHRGIPVTTAARTLLDLAAAGHPGLELALNEARVRQLAQPPELEALSRSGRRGGRAIRALIEDTPGHTRAGAERHLRSLIIKAQLPAPHFNARLGGYERDAVWPTHRLILEVDGFAAHGTRRAFEQDRRRDQELAAAGYRPLRVTWRQITGEPEAFIARLAGALARS